MLYACIGVHLRKGEGRRSKATGLFPSLQALVMQTTYQTHLQMVKAGESPHGGCETCRVSVMGSHHLAASHSRATNKTINGIYGQTTIDQFCVLILSTLQ